MFEHNEQRLANWNAYGISLCFNMFTKCKFT